MSPETPSFSLGPPDIVVERRADGTFLARSAHPLGPFAERMTDPLDHWAREASYRTFLAQRDARGHWRNVTYAEAQYFGRRIGQALLNRGLSVERPVAILSGNDIEHALLTIGAMYAGIPYFPISPHHSLGDSDFTVLRYIFKLMSPGLVFVSDGSTFERALRDVTPEDAEIVVNENLLPGATSFAELVNTEVEGSLEAVHAHVHGNTILKILFTSGTTGMPKGVLHTHRMWASNLEMLRHCFPFLVDEHPVLVSGLPWSTALGGNADLGLALYNGGSLYIDDGQSDRNLRAISPTVYWNTPAAFESLIPHLRADARFRTHFCSRLKFLGSGELSERVWDELKALEEERGETIPLVSGWNATEAVSHALVGVQASSCRACVGTPLPGVELKLVPAGNGNLEVRLRGPNVTLGYWRRLDLTRAAFDDEGFLRVGDFLRFVDPEDPSHGLVFGGRLSLATTPETNSNGAS